MPRIYDISPLVTSSLAVFPGDAPLSREVLMDLSRGDPVTLSTLRATVHLGAHADAPSHYGANARTIDEQPLDLYLGRAQVLSIDVQRGGLAGISDLKSGITEPRLLIRTGTFPDPERWNHDFAALDPALVDHLHERGVRLVGIDTPSVDPADSKDLPAHARFLAHDMAIIEGLVLNEVPDGVYELIALPLRLAGFDASPVRAILREFTTEGH